MGFHVPYIFFCDSLTPHCHFVSFVGPTEFLISRMCDWLSEPLLWHPAAHCVLDVFPWALAYRPCILTQGFVPLPSQWVLLHLWEHLQCLIHTCNDATMVSGAWCPGFLSTDVPEAFTLCLSSHCWPGQRACLPVHSVLFLSRSVTFLSLVIWRASAFPHQLRKGQDKCSLL